MADHVTEQFTASLQESIEGQSDPMSAMEKLGTAYIAFFEQHPPYPPFAVFRETDYRLFRSLGLPPKLDGTMLMAYWSLVHGVASLLSSNGIRYSGNWQKVWQIILQSGGTANETDCP